MSAPGRPLRVLDLTDQLAAAGARALVGLGGDVVRLVPAWPPAPGSGTDPDTLHWHAGKRIVAVDDVAARAAVADRLAAAADIVIESGPVAQLTGVRFVDGAPQSRWPERVHVVVTPFGLTGPRRDWTADDLVAAAAGGMAWLGGRADGPPKPPPREQARQLAGVHAAIAGLLALLGSERIGTGQLADVSAQEAVAATLETAAIAWIHAGRHPSRNGGVYEHVAHRIFPAADGWVAGGYSGSDRMWTDLLSWMREEGEAADLTDEQWADPDRRWQGRPHVDDVVARFAAQRPAGLLAEQGRRRALPWAEVVPPSALLTNPQLVARDFGLRIEGVELPGGAVEDVGFATATPGRPRPVTLAAPATTPAESVWTGGAGRARRPAPPRPGPAVRPLEGVRVLDLTWVLAGPYATKTFADFGADVIKVESRHRQDPTRFAPGMRLRPGAGPDDSGYFLNFNRNKRSVALNLRTADGPRLLRELAGTADVVIENFSPGVLARWGLDHPTLSARRPGVIVASMAGTGQTGPWRDAVTFADTLAAMSGLSHETADPGGPPQGLTFGLGDMVAANATVLAVLDLLRAGRGGHVDLSQLEAMAAALGSAALEPQLPEQEPSGATPEHPDRDRHRCPRGSYPTAGADRWIALSIAGEQQWRTLTTMCAELREFAPLEWRGRKAVEDRIDDALARWTSGQDGAALAARLQAAGIAAAVVATGRDLVEDEHLAQRGFYPVLEHRIAGAVRHEGIVERLSATPGALRTAAPLLGEHTDEVLRELLGLDAATLTDLRSRGVLE